MFAKTTGQPILEDLLSIKNRQSMKCLYLHDVVLISILRFSHDYFTFLPGIQKLVLAGRIGDAIETTQKLYPGLLERNPNLLFLLKCRQFVEMVSGNDSDVRGPGIHSPTRSNKATPCSSPTHPHSGNSGSGSSLNSPSHSSNGFMSNGIQNGINCDEETLMEIEEENETRIVRNGSHNGDALQEEVSISPRQGNVDCRS